jgi:hypothetical protein
MQNCSTLSKGRIPKIGDYLGVFSENLGKTTASMRREPFWYTQRTVINSMLSRKNIFISNKIS